MLELYGPDPDDVSHRQILDYLAIRKTEFVDRLKWQVPHTDIHEWDQYDLPDALFVVAYAEGKCVGGARIIKTTAKPANFFGIHRTWMIADFVANRIGGMDESQLSESICAQNDTWEMTRFVANNPTTTAALLAKINIYLAATGAKNVLTLSPVLMSRALRRLGYTTDVISNVLEFDGRNFVVLRTKVKPVAS